MHMGKSAIAIIPARGGSKRIPGKNKKDFCGRPILEYSVRAALDSGAFDEVMVSTDDDGIADMAREFGASVPFMRSGETAGDFATTTDVVLEVLREYEKAGRRFESFCCLYPTAPFATAEKLRDAMALLRESDIDSVIPVAAFPFPPMRGMYVRGGRPEYCFPECELKRSQDLEPMYYDCGQFYCARTDGFVERGRFLSERTRAIIVPEGEVQDIDTPEDWKLAELKYGAIMERAAADSNKSAATPAPAPRAGDAGASAGDRAQRFRKVRESDLATILEWRTRPDITKFMLTDPKLTMEDQERWFKKISADEDSFYWIYESGGAPQGLVSLVDWDRDAGVIHTGGYIAERPGRALQSIVDVNMNLYDFAFSELGVNRAALEVMSNNMSQVRWMERIGAAREGVLRQAVKKNGVYYDLYCLSFLREEWDGVLRKNRFNRIDIER